MNLGSYTSSPVKGQDKVEGRRDDIIKGETRTPDFVRMRARCEEALGLPPLVR